MDLGFEAAGISTVWMCEKDTLARQLLRLHWPTMPIFHDVRGVLEADAQTVDLIHGGDPCPRHSRALQIDCDTPDLSGYFLAVVGQMRPRWVVRENVLAPTVDDFAAALEWLGYGVVVIGMDGAAITGQSRPREFVVGCFGRSREEVRVVFSEAESGPIPYQTTRQSKQAVHCLSTSQWRNGVGDYLVWDEGERLRNLSSSERERLAGLPPGWTAGFSRQARAKFAGNAVIPAKAQWIGERIVKFEV